MDQLIQIDGSKYEGGGQMMRMAIAYSVLLQKPFKMINIRSARPNPGINNQLKSQLDLITPLVNAKVTGCVIGSQEVQFEPQGRLNTDKLLCKATSAQSVTLVLQSLLPIAVFGNQQKEIVVQGGTTVYNSPPIRTFKDGFIRFLQQMNINVDIQVLQDGFYPKGGGTIKTIIQPCNKIKPIQLNQIQPINKVLIEYILAQDADVEQYNQLISDKLKQYNNGAQIEISSSIKLINSNKFKNCYGIIAMSKSDVNMYDHSKVCSIDKPLQDVVQEVLQNITNDLQCAVSVDSHLQDQFIIFMALADGESHLKIGPLTNHLHSALYLTKLFIPDIEIAYDTVDNQRFNLRMKGINYQYI